MENKKKKSFLMVIGALVLYLASTGLSYGFFKFLSEPVETGEVTALPVEEARSQLDVSGPKTEACPLNGKLYTKIERSIWEGRRPLTVMVENHEEARSQSGLSRADIVYEAVAEGGITRFLAVFFCGASAEDLTVGPVRSARTYYLDWASEYSDYPLYAHVGGANLSGPADALGQISQYGWLSRGNDMNQFALGFPVFWRDYERIGHEVATEHTMYSSTDKLWGVAKSRGLEAVDEEGNRWDDSFVSWKFNQEDEVVSGGTKDKISFNFWEGYAQYAVDWQYNSGSNEYLRLNGGQPHKDLNNENQLKATVVIVQFVKETGPIDDLKHMLYGTTGKGNALVFQGGEVTKATWSKADRKARTVFKDAQGQEIKFNPGTIWLEMVPIGGEVSY